jgi:hypothetical protein
MAEGRVFGHANATRVQPQAGEKLSIKLPNVHLPPESPLQMAHEVCVHPCRSYQHARGELRDRQQGQQRDCRLHPFAPKRHSHSNFRRVMRKWIGPVGQIRARANLSARCAACGANECAPASCGYFEKRYLAWPGRWFPARNRRWWRRLTNKLRKAAP